MKGAIASLPIAPGRRIFGVGALIVLGLMLIILAFTTDANFGLRVLVFGFGVGAIFAARAMRRATAQVMYLVPEGLFLGNGDVIALLPDIEAVDRGMFAFKPTNGFLLKLRTPQPWAWAPGLYWRYRRRLGVGGVTSPGHAKAMADQIAVILANRPVA